MTHAKKLLLAVLALSLFLATIFSLIIFQKARSMEKIHILKAPLSIGSEKDVNYYLLPKGTYLYFDSAFPEGFNRYKIYVNIKENLALQDNIEHVEAPISADSISKTLLLDLLKNVKLDKDDIKSILNNGKYSDADKIEVAELLKK